MADLPVEVISLILSYLPVKSLLRFRSACKLFRSLIDSPTFISLHLQNSSRNILILRHNSDVHIVGFDALDVAFDMSPPFTCRSVPLKVVGSCNGLLLVSNVFEDAALWNPCTRKYRRILFSLLEETTRTESHKKELVASRVYGFGYDSESDDYKIIKISYFSDTLTGNKDIEPWVKVYSLRTNSCTSRQCPPYLLTAGVYVGGNIHWAVSKNFKRGFPDMIIAFDLKCDEFKEVPLLPKLMLGVESFEIGVALLGRDLCVFVNYKNRVDVWVMKEYGNIESWCNLFTFYQPVECGSLKRMRPLSYSRDGKKVLLEVDKKRLCWFDLESNRTSFVTLTSETKLIEGTICVASLVSPALQSFSFDP